MEGVMMLQSAVHEVPAAYAETRHCDWQDYLDNQAAAHPLFRRRQICMLGGKGRVVLTGTVASYYEKQVAQEFVRRCDGVKHIDNRLEVAYRA